MIIQCHSVGIRGELRIVYHGETRNSADRIIKMNYRISAVQFCSFATSPVLRDPVVRKNHIEVRGRHSYFAAFPACSPTFRFLMRGCRRAAGIWPKGHLRP